MKFMEVSSIRQMNYSSTKPRLGNGDNFFQGSHIDATLLQKEKGKRKDETPL
jgi:hypothetical protein